jgi:apolipoprotein N-acyltransferase
VPRKPTILTLPADRPALSQAVFFLLGCLATLAFAPFRWYWLLPVLLLPLLQVCLTLSPRDAARHLFWFGFGQFLTGTYWIYISVVIFGQAPVWVAVLLMFGLVLIMSFYLGVTGWLIGRLSGGEPWSLLAIAPAGWVLVEWLRGWVLTGFPWLALGYSQIDGPLAGFAPVAGVYGVSAMLLLSAAAVLVALHVRGRPQLIAIAVAVLPWIVGGMLRSIDWTEPAGPPLRVTLIQGAIPQDRKWLPEQFRPTLEYYLKETLRARGSDIVVWPEVAIPSVSDRVEGYLSALNADSLETGQTILLGILERAAGPGGDVRIYNSVFAFDGGARQVYRKRHLVPFGEYFPVPDRVREWMRMLSLPHNDLAAGSEDQPLIVTPGGARLAVAICYEDAYGAEQLSALPAASLLVNVSNDAWFGDSIAPHQHLQIARMRALEAGRDVVRATNTGISAFIGADGRVVQTGPQFKPATMTMDVEQRRGSTPYAAAGNRPIIILCLLAIGAVWLRSRAS